MYMNFPIRTIKRNFKSQRFAFSLPLLVCCFLLGFTSCDKSDGCPPNEILGRLSLDAQSGSFLPYNNIRFLEFVDSLALDTAVLYDPQSLVRDSSWTVVENICEEDELRSDKYFLSEHLTINYYDLDTARKLRLIGNLGVVEDALSKVSTVADPVLYDELKLTVHRSNPSVSGSVASISFVASARGNDARLSDSIKVKLSRYPLIPSVRINDSIYTNVYEFKFRDSAVFYFKPLEGLVAFRSLDNKWWNLHRKY